MRLWNRARYHRLTVVYTRGTVHSLFCMPRIIFITFVLLVGTTVSLFVVAPVLRAASALELAVGECKKRTGFGDSTCTTLIKKYMNVDRCKEYTGYSDAECAQKIEEIKNESITAPSLSETPSSTVTKPDVPPASGALPPITSRSDGTLTGLREKKERDLIALWKRTEAMTNMLKDRGVDTQAIEAAFPEFERRAEALLGAYDTYRSVSDGTAKEAQAARPAILEDARWKVVQAKESLIEYYQTTILLPLRTAHEQNI